MIFSKTYNIILNWADKKQSIYYLALLSFIEAFILPYPPPDVLLAPIVLKKPLQKYRLVIITTIFSVLGGIVGYSIGYFAYDIIYPYLVKFNYTEHLEHLKSWFDIYGIWVIAIAGFSPVPYKLFTIIAGLLSFALLPFIIISLLSRGLRFLIVAIIVAKFGNKIDSLLKKYVDMLGYSLLLLALLVYFYKEYF